MRETKWKQPKYWNIYLKSQIGKKLIIWVQPNQTYANCCIFAIQLYLFLQKYDCFPCIRLYLLMKQKTTKFYFQFSCIYFKNILWASCIPLIPSWLAILYFKSLNLVQKPSISIHNIIQHWLTILFYPAAIFPFPGSHSITKTDSYNIQSKQGRKSNAEKRALFVDCLIAIIVSEHLWHTCYYYCSFQCSQITKTLSGKQGSLG